MPDGGLHEGLRGGLSGGLLGGLSLAGDPEPAPVAADGWTGWLHRAGGDGGSGVGVLMVGTIGFEGLCAHRAWRGLGDRFARAGVHALRLTLPGTGDAPEPDGLPDLVPRWLDAIDGAGDWIRRALALDEVVPCGLHLGALLAAHAAARERSSAGSKAAEGGEAPPEARAPKGAPWPMGGRGRLVLLAPPPSGGRYLREQRTRARVAGFPGGAAAPGETEAPALRLHDAVVRDIEALSLARLPRAPARRVLLLGRAGTTGVGGVAGALAAQGAETRAGTFEGYDALMGDAHMAKPPDAVWGRVVDWVGEAAPGTPHGRASLSFPPGDAPMGHPARTPGRVPAFVPSHPGEAWTDRPVRIPAAPSGDRATGRFANGSPRGDGVALAGVHTGPAGRAPGELAVVVIGTGAVPHAGYGRGAAHLSRRLAAAGVWSLRFDFAGTGDSGGEEDVDLARLYDPARVAETRAALDWMCGMGHRRFVLVGTCSGAFQAMQAGLADERVEGLVLANQLFYGAWGGGGLEGWHRRREARASRAKRHDGEAGARPCAAPASHGRASLAFPSGHSGRRLLQAGLGAALRLEQLRIEAGRLAGVGAPHRRFRALAARGVRTLVLASEGDGALPLLERHYGAGGRRLARDGGTEVLVTPAFDHSLGLAAAQRFLADEVERLLSRFWTEDRSPRTAER